ncbi:MAG: hypothetical protein EBU08_06855, partial [Micrococcales bacterium]|nr:hypothetical protein [Micrococcales bacterium]
LNVIINDALGWSPLTNFRELSNTKKKQFNIKLNQYINDLPDEKKLIDDFNLVCQLKVFDDIKPEECFIKELNTERQVLMTPEQEEWHKESPLYV